MSEQEEWRTIPGHPQYEVSDRGRVRSWVPWPALAPQPTQARILKGSSAGSGDRYRRVWIGNRHQYVHRLVALAFIGPCPDGQMVRHLNDEPSDNRLANLAYGDMSQNQMDAFRNGRRVHVSECHRGHLLYGPNVYHHPSGQRVCKECRRGYAAKYKARLRAERSGVKAVA